MITFHANVSDNHSLKYILLYCSDFFKKNPYTESITQPFEITLLVSTCFQQLRFSTSLNYTFKQM